MTTEQKVTRKLRAILSADVKGYSLLMTNDEVSTIQTLKEYRVIMSGIIKQHSGRVVDAPGDNMLAEFSSVVNAVQCSVEIQNALKTRNADLPDDKRLVFRIGVNIGDVVQDGDSLYGEGVNIAARIEGLADPGGVCISRGAYDHVKNKLKLGYEYIGDHAVKNIKDPVRVYKILMDSKDPGKLIGEKPKSQTAKWIFSTIIVAAIALTLIGYQLFQKISAPEFEPASIEKMAFPLPDKPSIAVLPFDNLSGDQSQEYIADGLSESIISSLAKIPDMLVIARNSTFVYKGKAVEVNQVAEELGIRYVLEGSIQKSGDNLRVIAQLVDAVEGHHLWSETYDRKMKDFFAVQDDITRNIVVSLQVELTEGEQALIWHSTQNLKAWGYATKGIALMQLYTKEKVARARELFKKAVELDPNYAFAWLSIAWTHAIDSRYGFSESREESLKQCIKFTEKAAKLNYAMPEIHSTWNLIYMLQGQYDKAIAEGKNAVALGPSDATNHLLLSLTMHYAGRFKEAIFHIKKAMRLDPYYPTAHLYMLGNSYCMAKEYENAIVILEKAMERTEKAGNQHANNYTSLIQALVEFDQIGKAKQHAVELLKLNPNFSIKNWQKSLPYKNPADQERHLDALRKAGLPEEPPLPLSNKPSIAVLPFDNLSNDPDQEYFSDGMTDELICDLAKIENILVISRNSTFTYKGKPTKAQEIAKDLNVRYILEGSVQKVGSQVRIRTQLIDGKTDHHIWSESYDGVMDDIFELQDEITGKIVAALSIKLSVAEQSKLTEKRTISIPAHDTYLKGMAHLRLWTPDDLVKAIEYFKEAVELDPNYGQAYTALAEAYFFNIVGGSKYWKKTGTDYQESHIFNRHYIELAMKNPVPKTFSVFAISEVRIRHYNEAIKYAQKALTLAPNDADVLYYAGLSFFWAGKLQEALKHLKKSNRLEPRNRSAAFMVCPYFSLKQYEKAVASFEKSSSNIRDLNDILPFAAASYGYLGRKEEARAILDKWIGSLGGRPNVDLLYGTYRFKNFESFDHFIKGLKNAGRDGSIATTIKINEKDKLSSQEIKKLMFGKTEAGYGYFSFYEEFFHRKENGAVSYHVGDTIKKGSSWIKDDMLCNKFEEIAGGCNDCLDIYKNPTGEYLFKNEYLKVTDYGIIPFSIKQKEN